MSAVKDHFDAISKKYDSYKKRNWYYYDNLKQLLTELIPSKRKVLEIGCGTGDLLVMLQPQTGVGTDLSQGMIKLAQKKHKRSTNVKFSTSSVTKQTKPTFDYIFMSDVIEHLEHPQDMFNQIAKIMKKQTTFICTMANPKLETVLMIAEKLNLKMPEGDHYRWTSSQTLKMLRSSGLKVVVHKRRLLFPIYLPIISNLINKYLSGVFNQYAFIEYFVAIKS